MLRGLR